MQTNSGAVKVQKVTAAKDLGVSFDQNLKFTEHINIKENKANKNVGLIFRTLTFMNKDMFLSIYKSVVISHLEYASSVCSPMFKKVIRLQRSGIDTIKYHTWPRIPMGKWQTHRRHHKREPRGQPFPSRWPQSTYKQTRTKHSKHKTEQKHKRSTKEVPPWNSQ